MKSMNMISTTGFKPVNAMPTAAEVMADSEMGVSITRPGPKVSSRPRVALKDPPAFATSSPMTTTVESCSMQSRRACVTALA
ncbi:hypothetical protein D3C71_1312540 [compost metagenome]